MQNSQYDILIIGGGPAGLTAGIYASRASLKTLLVAGPLAGGQLMWTTEVENYPGFPEGIMGPELMENFKKQAVRFGMEYAEGIVNGVSGTYKEGFTVKTEDGTEYSAKTIVIASGASAKWLPLPSVEKLKGKGVSACATCDGFFYKDKVTAVVGGGDAAMEEATYLTKFSPKVYILVRKGEEEMKASKIMLERAKANEKIEFVCGTEVVEVLGENSVEGILVKNTKDGEERKMEDVQGVFMAIGHKPNTDFLKGFIELGKLGYIEPIDATKTSVEGVFTAGDVGDYRYQQAVSAAGMGCMAALDAEKLLNEG